MTLLALRLENIAQGVYYDGAALMKAYDSEVVTYNDKQVLSRYMNGSELTSDRFRLQEIANNFRK